MRPQTPVYLLLTVPIMAICLLVAVFSTVPTHIRAQGDSTLDQRTVDAFVQQAFTQTAQAQPTPNITQTLEAAVLNAVNATETMNARIQTSAAASPQVRFTAAPTSTPTPSFAAERLELESVQEYALLASPGLTSAHLAPNGDVFVHINENTICLYTPDGERGECNEIDGEDLNGYIDADSVRWSPDSTRLVFTTDTLRTLREGDIWLYDTRNGDLENLTDDGYTDDLLGDTPGLLNIDLAPSWSPDDRQIAFIRYPINMPRAGDFAYEMEICTLTLETGEETCAEPFPGVEVGLSVYNLDWSPDGDTLVFPVDNRQESVFTGLWRYSVAEQVATWVVPLVETEEIGEMNYNQVEVSPDGRYVLAEISEAASQLNNQWELELSRFRVIDLEERETVLIDPERYIISAGWLPNSGLVYLSRPYFEEVEDRFRVENWYVEVAVNDAPNTVGRTLTTHIELGLKDVAPGLIPPTTYGRKPLVWSARNSLLVTTIGDLTLLLQFGDGV